MVLCVTWRISVLLLQFGKGAGKMQKSMIKLIWTLWDELRSDPVQLEYFIILNENTKAPIQMVLFTTLIPYLYALEKPGQQVRESILWSVGLNDPTLVHFILNRTQFVSKLAQGIDVAYSHLSTQMRKLNETQISAISSAKVLASDNAQDYLGFLSKFLTRVQVSYGKWHF